MKTIHSLDCPEQAGLGPQSDPSRSLLYCPAVMKGMARFLNFFIIHLFVLGFSLNCPNSSLTPLCLPPSQCLLLSLSPPTSLSPFFPPPSPSLSLACCWAGLHTGRSLMPEIGLGPVFQNPGARSLVFPKFQACIEAFHAIA